METSTQSTELAAQVGMTCTMAFGDFVYSLEMTYDWKSYQLEVRTRSGVLGPWYEARYMFTSLGVEAMDERMVMARKHWQAQLGERYSTQSWSLSDWELFCQVINLVELGTAKA